MEDLIIAERRAKVEDRRQPEATSLPNTPPADPAAAKQLAPQADIPAEAGRLGKEDDRRPAAPSGEQTCAPPAVVSDAGRVCAPLVFAKTGDSPEPAPCSRGSGSVVESGFITKRQFADDVQMMG